MADDFWGGLGNMLGEVTGYNQAQQAAAQRGQGQAQQAAAGQALGGIAGKGAGQFAQEAATAGRGLGEEMGVEAARQGATEGAQAARTAGLNKGQAAMQGAQQAGGAYTRGAQAGRGMGMSAYGQGAQTQLGGAQAQGALGTSQMAGATEAGKAGTEATGGLIAGIGKTIAGLSDEEAKTEIKKAPSIEEILAKIRPAQFKYKPEIGEGEGTHVGVIAQDLEKTPLKENVVETPMGKAISTPKQENSNLNLIVQLGARIAELERQLAGGS